MTRPAAEVKPAAAVIAKAIREAPGRHSQLGAGSLTTLILEALREARIELVQLPEPDGVQPATEDENGYREWDYPHGHVMVFDDGVIGWEQWHISDPQKVRAAGAALLAAAAVSVEGQTQ